MVTLQAIEQKFMQLKSKRDVLVEQLEKSNTELASLKINIETIQKSRAVVQEVAQKTQQNLEFHISNIVSMALSAVFPKPPGFVVRFEVRRNKTECDLLFVEDENEYSPLTGSGGGPIDIASFALRVAYWSLNKNRPVLILDEPFRNLSPDLHEKAGEMLKLVSERLCLQIIMVSHSDDINIHADKTFVVRKKAQLSDITEL